MALQALSAVLGGCQSLHANGLDEALAVSYNDIDFCLRAVSKGFRVIWTPFATLIHHESATRGSDETRANRARFERDKDSLRRRHKTETFEDRAFSPWYTRDRSEPRPLLLARLPDSR